MPLSEASCAVRVFCCPVSLATFALAASAAAFAAASFVCAAVAAVARAAFATDACSPSAVAVFWSCSASARILAEVSPSLFIVPRTSSRLPASCPSRSRATVRLPCPSRASWAASWPASRDDAAAFCCAAFAWECSLSAAAVAESREFLASRYSSPASRATLPAAADWSWSVPMRPVIFLISACLAAAFCSAFSTSAQVGKVGSSAEAVDVPRLTQSATTTRTDNAPMERGSARISLLPTLARDDSLCAGPMQSPNRVATSLKSHQ